jgi:hypothetical protein
MRRALADGALQPIEIQAILLVSDGVRFVVRTASSLASRDKARHVAAARDPLGDYVGILLRCMTDAEFPEAAGATGRCRARICLVSVAAIATCARD